LRGWRAAARQFLRASFSYYRFVLLTKSLLLGCTGSIAVLQAPFLIVDLRVNYGIEVEVLMTANARKFITPFSLEVISGNSVVVDPFGDNSRIHFIKYVQSNPVFLIAPATANTIAKIANGIADNIVTLCASACFASSTKLLMAPVMNTLVWNNPIVQHNIERLVSKGVQFVGPSAGIAIDSMCEGTSAMASNEEIIEKLQQIHSGYRAEPSKPGP
jgi:phosphopantothenoylcysteine synthetase/decarboxylase